jgi:hypothetical protein
MRYLSDREKFQMMFEAFNYRKTLFLKLKKKNNIYFESYEQIKYESFEQFMKMNPNCCAIVPGRLKDRRREAWLSYLWNRITGYNSGEVIVMTFTVRYLDENGEQRTQKVTTQNVLKNCGKVKGILSTF